MPTSPLDLSPVSTLLDRTRAELSANFVFGKPVTIARAPGSLEVMGGIAQHTGSLACIAPLTCGAAVVAQERDDRQLQVFSFNLLDQHLPFTLQMSLDALARCDIEMLRAGFNQPGRKWADYVIGCVRVLHDQQCIDLTSPALTGLNLATLSEIPERADLGHDHAITVAAMSCVIEALEIDVDSIDAQRFVSLCQAVARDLAGDAIAPADLWANAMPQAGALTRVLAQPGRLQAHLPLPEGVTILAIDTGGRRDPALARRAICAARIGHALILEEMQRMAAAAGKTLTGDPTAGHLANLDPADYKRFFRGRLPETTTGQVFLDRGATTVPGLDPQQSYAVQESTDHFLLDARRAREFAGYIEQAQTQTGAEKKLTLDKAGHLMYASHISGTNNVGLGSEIAGKFVDLVRASESAGLYGARLTGVASGTVAVLCNDTAEAREKLIELLGQLPGPLGASARVFETEQRALFLSGAQQIEWPA
jgi:galactokinase